MVPSETLVRAGDGTDRKLQLVVVEGELVSVHDLPETGMLLVGRGADVDVSIADPGASARHARLHVDQGAISIEDLGSRNGTQVRGQAVPAHEKVALAAGEAALLGLAVLLVQRRNPQLLRRRSLPHGYFELRLTEECELAQDTNACARFSVARVDVDRSLPNDVVMESAAELLRSSDVLGTYGPSAFEILLPRTTPEAAEQVLRPFLDRLRQLKGNPRYFLAHFPADGQNAHNLIERACAGLHPRATNGSEAAVIVIDDRMRAVFRMAEKAASGIINVLIVGETGVGKEVVAETIHRSSKRVTRPFLCLNCAALAENLLESELFGHERGAFTDARTAKPGLLESASGGTVFLDEIGEMSPGLQSKLLRVIETKQVTRVGGLKPIPIDVRFVAATNRDLIQEIREKRFRSDLYYRINGLTLEVPPLRERRAEILPLCESFLAELARQSGQTRPPRLSDEAAAWLESHAWPGNIREVRNVMERAFLLAGGSDIEIEDLPLESLDAMANVASPPAAETSVAPDERARIVESLVAEGGNQTRAARRLGISRGTLMARLEAFEIPRPQKRR